METKGKITDHLRSCETTETPETKASRAKRWHVIYTGDCACFYHGYDTAAEAVAATVGKGSSIAIWDTEKTRQHYKNRHNNFAWCPAFPKE